MSSYPKGVRAQPPQAPSDYASTGATTGGAAPSVPVKDPTTDLLLWKNPIETGKYFGLSLLTLLILKKVNLITFFLRVLYTVIFTTGGIEFVSKVVLGQGLVSKYSLKECPNVVGCLRPRIEELLRHLPTYQAKLRTLVFADEPKQNMKAGLVLYFLHKFFSWFSVWTIVFLGVISAFTLPLVYHTHQEEIDAAVNHALKIARAKSAEFSKIASEKSRPYLEKLDCKLGPVSKFVKTQYANYNRASAAPKTTSSAAPQATTAGLAAKVPFEHSAAPTGSEEQGAYVSGHAPSATTAASRGVPSSRSAAAGAAGTAGAATHEAHPSEAFSQKQTSSPLQATAQTFSSHIPTETPTAGSTGISHHHLSDLNDEYNSHFGHDFSVHDVEDAANKASDKTGHKFPQVPSSNPLSSEANHDFSVDQLQNELRQNKDSLTQELNFNKH
ncbi:hypothetical protein ZYGR_0A04440 [Zygosaccharomyces rouxii]|uniref:Reticulon-like protein n=2 Tax=Zygosaccharomyces rouxii TaxID=4956 RepID=C5DQB0_ZYGRC|nr:uncharacterized protein ZYRO0A10054g [Zygosaccharomyces rouxii]KAH9198610.1 Reticulon-domain-containing protein [Zygosaccharomyces rouxii]GAV46846.1 hypothetical protein ZYGR_0A04440 [Zygosaccharomyces rouxii]CAR25871.1 ZYRO0A10054p [Zygosaccharomyces rouxii]